MLSSRRHALQGFTLTELAIVLGILGLLLGIVWITLGKVEQERLANRAIEQTMITVQNIRSLYKATGRINTPSNFTTANMVRAGVFSSSMLDGSAIPRSPWGTNITLAAPSTTSFSLTFENTLSNINCRNLAGRIAGATRDPGLQSVTVNGTVISGNALDTLTPISATLNTCSTVTLTFGIQ